ncbi:MAG: diguanylate cyclase [Pseudanabaenaceae cyanobacterium bins.68]|nr:diguanylate cyclase [Pseudanabaenaceae cyanobacterium bins.68]
MLFNLDVLFGRSSIMPPEWWADFLAEWNHLIYWRVRAVAWLTFLYPLIAVPLMNSGRLKIDHPRFEQAPLFLTALLLCIAVLSAYILFLPRHSQPNFARSIRRAINFYLVTIVFLLTGIFMAIWIATGLNAPYLIYIFVYAVLFYRPSRRSFLLYVVNFCGYIAIISMFGQDIPTSHLATAYISGILATILALIVANSLFDAKVKNFVNRRQIEQQAEALQIANARLSLLANLDGLTQIANRRQFDTYLAQQWQQLNRSGTYLSLLICDVDHFKLFNDTYGHQAGDECLKQVAIAINQAVERDGDLAARYGGEEFGVILPNTPKEGAIAIAAKICTQVRELNIPHTGSSHGQVTISIGVASIIPSSRFEPTQLVATADDALYCAKHHGRNRHLYHELDPELLNQGSNGKSRLPVV